MNAECKLEGLTEAQRETVAQNLGLVGMQIKRLLGQGVPRACVQEFREELFQEGCLGLIQAVQTYVPTRGMSFATYAVPRIYYAALRALRRYREIIRLPERHKQRGTDRSAADDPGTGGTRRQRPDRPDLDDTTTAPTDEAQSGHPRRGRATATRANPYHQPHTPRVRSYTPEEMNALPAKVHPGSPRDHRSEAARQGDPVTIGLLLRQKLAAAVDEAVTRLSTLNPMRDGRGPLARKLAEERLLIPEAEFRTPLRQIARETRSSFGRVAACEASLVAEVRRLLSADAEFAALSEEGTGHPAGMETTIDDQWRATLRESAVDGLLRHFADLPRAEQADVLLTVLEKAGADVATLLSTHIRGLTDAEQTRLLAMMTRERAARGGGAETPRRSEPVLTTE
ncbi:MAG: sigma factor [Planctomycetota bacterium]